MTNGFNPTPKRRGDLIRSRDWNETMDEVVRLGKTKLDAAEFMRDPLTIASALVATKDVTVGTAGQPASLSVSGTLSASRLEGDGSALTGIEAGKWSDMADGQGIYYNDGKVGIGTDSPPWRLTVQDGEFVVYNVVDGQRKGWTGWWNQDHVTINAYDWDGGQFQPLRIDGSVLALNSVSGGNVGIGTMSPAGKLEVNGTAVIANGSGFAAGRNFMAPGSLTIGGIDANYGGGSQWNDNTAALLLECADNTEVAVHDAQTRLTSLMYFEGANANRITIGRDMGWGAVNQVAMNGSLQILSNSNPVLFTSGWTGFPDSVENQAEISNDTGDYQTLMIVGNKSAGMGRRVSVWDRLEVNGTLVTSGNVGVGTATPGAPLHVATYMAVGPFSATGGQGGIDLTGDAAELGLVKRTLTAWPEAPAAGDRFVWYNPDGTARLWTHNVGDLVTVTSDGTVTAARFVGDGSGLTGIQGGGGGGGGKWSDSGDGGLYFSGGDVTVGWTTTGRTLRILNRQQDPQNSKGDALVLGAVDNPRLRMGYAASYSWIQAGPGLPLALNPQEGHVGIGTATVPNPHGWNRVVDILGTDHARLNVRSSGGVITSMFSHDNWNGPRGIIGTESDHPLTFATKYTHHMTLDTAGNLGIGTPTPGAKLQVNGNVIASNLSVASKNDTRGALFLATQGDFNHAIYNNFSDIDGDGSWDGSKWNAYDGLHIRVGGGSNKKTALAINNQGRVSVQSSAIPHGTNDYQLEVYSPDTGKAQDFTKIRFHQGNQYWGWLGYHAYTTGGGDGEFVFFNLNSSLAAQVQVGKLRLGDKFLLSGIGDVQANDDWLRLLDVNNTGYYGGFAAGRLYTAQGQLAGSDLRLKQDVATLDGALDKLTALRGVSFRWRNPDAQPAPRLGLIAQEVEQIFPEAVETGPDGMKGVNYGSLIAPLVEAVKQQQAQIKSLQAEVQTLSGAKEESIR